MNGISAENLKEFLSDLCAEFGLLSVATMTLSEEKKSIILNKLKDIYRPDNPSIASAYILRSLQRRSNPFAERPWAKSLLCLAVPLDIIPTLEIKIPRQSYNEKPLRSTNYAGRLDYHIFCTEIIRKFVSRLENKLALSLKNEVCVDIKAVPEKILANFAKLGKIGFNNCLICKASSSFFIALAFIDIELPNTSLDESELPCESCGKCLELCPTKALLPNGFEPQKCISYLTMEKKTPLSPEEKKMTGKNIFGCDICTSACPGSSKYPPFELNSAWLMELNEEEFCKIFAKSPILYAGLERLKKTATTATV